jgi:hypothetical protein
VSKMASLRRNGSFKLLHFLNLIAAFWIPFGKLKFCSNFKQKLVRLYEIFVLFIFLSAASATLWKYAELNFQLHIAFFGKGLLYVTGFLSVSFKTGYLIGMRAKFVGLIKKYEKILKNPVLHHYKINSFAKVSRFAIKTLIFQLLFFISIQTLALSIGQIALKSENEHNSTNNSDSFSHALGIKKLDFTSETVIIFVSAAGSFTSFKVIVTDCLIFYFYSLINMQIMCLKNMLTNAAHAEVKLKTQISIYSPLLNMTAWNRLWRLTSE